MDLGTIVRNEGRETDSMPTSWTDAKKFLNEHVIALMAAPNQPTGHAWLNSLPNCMDGELVGVCIAIDIASEALDPHTFASILDNLKSSPKNARLRFAEAIDSHACKRDFVCASKLDAPPLRCPDHYVRVLELRRFITYYAGPSFGYSDLDPADVEEVRRIFFTKSTSLGSIKEWWAGKNGRVWVTSKRELEQLVEKYPGEDAASLFNDALGLGYANGAGKDNLPEIVAVNYPLNFSIGCTQPTTLDAWWEDEGKFYISNGREDGWGKTQSCSGSYDKVRERVHSEFKNLTSDYFTCYFGIAKVPIKNRNALMEEAYERFEVGISVSHG